MDQDAGVHWLMSPWMEMDVENPPLMPKKNDAFSSSSSHSDSEHKLSASEEVESSLSVLQPLLLSLLSTPLGSMKHKTRKIISAL